MSLNWNKLTEWITDNTEFECEEKRDYISFYLKNNPTEMDPLYIELMKKNCKTIENLKQYFMDEYVDFDADDFCREWLNRKKSGDLNVPEIHKLLKQADYIEYCLEDIWIKLANNRNFREQKII